MASLGTMKLARRVAVCPLTIRRRTRLLAERGLAFADPRKFFLVTDAGRAALGEAQPSKPPEPWVRKVLISAARARDVLERSTDDRSALMKSQHGSLARLKAVATARANKTAPFNQPRELGSLDRMAG